MIDAGGRRHDARLARLRPARAPLPRLPSILGLAWLVVLALIVGLAVAYRAAPLVGYELIVVRGSSMSPAIPLGALVAVRDADVAEVRPGMVVTVRADNGVLITHRVSRMTEAGGQTFLELHGDANATADPTLVPGRTVVGIVDRQAPLLGYLVAMLSSPSGLVSVLAALACIYLATLLLEPDEPNPRERRPAGHAAGT